jgi:molybdate transport system permease protein
MVIPAQRSGTDTPSAARTPPPQPSRVLTRGLAIVAVLFLGLPIFALVARAVAGGLLVQTLGEPIILDALVLSLTTTAVTLVLTVAFGTPLAYVLARRRFRGAAIIETLVDLPIVLPPSVAGLGLLLLLGRAGILGGALSGIGVDLAFSTAAVVLAQTFVAAPFYVRSARTGFALIDQDLEDAARTDGASERQVLRWITLPLAASALATGLVTTWARALGEFGATIMFAGSIQGTTQTLPLVVYAQFEGSLDASIAAAAILVLAAFGVLVAIRLGGRRVLVGSFGSRSFGARSSSEPPNLPLDLGRPGS